MFSLFLLLKRYFALSKYRYYYHYPSVTPFHNNQPRYYRKEDTTGQWVRYHYKTEEHSSPSAATAAVAVAAAAVAIVARA